jgi:kumamolisin
MRRNHSRRQHSESVPLAGSLKVATNKASIIKEPPAGDFVVRVVVRSKPNAKRTALAHSAALNANVRDRKYLSRKEHEEQFGADPADIKKVEDFAVAKGLKVVSSNPAQRTVLLSGNAAQFSQAFQVQLATSVIKGRAYRSRSGFVKVPSDLNGIVTGVFGLDRRPFAKPHYRVSRGIENRTATPPKIASRAAAAGSGQPAGSGGAATVVAAAHAEPFPTGFTPPQIAELYNFPKATDGTGQTIAILELGGGFRPAELATYFGQIGVKNPNVSVASYENGGTNNPGTDPFDENNPDVEVLLDIEVAGSVAPGAKVVVYFAPDASDESFIGAMSVIIHDSGNNPNIISISWGGPEDEATEQFKTEFNRLLQSAAQMGITVCVASGDDGSSDFASDDPYWDGNAHVDFPSSDPYTLACGGTRLTAADGKIKSEVTWDEADNVGTGGGVSRYFALPDYQQNAGVPNAAAPAGAVMRGVPDVAGNAAQESGYRILCDGQQFPDEAQQVPPVGGTSAVAPLWAGLIARLNQSLGNPVGFLNPVLYAIDPKSGAFQDITDGKNGVYSASKGWDPCTGLGTPNGENLLAGLQPPAAGSPAPPSNPTQTGAAPTGSGPTNPVATGTPTSGTPTPPPPEGSTPLDGCQPAKN